MSANEQATSPRRKDHRGLVLPLAILVLWWLSSHLHWVNQHLLPSPVAVGARAGRMLGSGDFWIAVLCSLARALSGYLIAVVVGLAVGVLLGRSRISNKLGGPLFNAFRQVAPFAWIPLISAWCGDGERSKVAFVATIAFTPIALNTIEGVQALAREQSELGRVLSLNRWQYLRTIAIPAASPRVLAGAQLGLITAWLATVGAEFFLNIAPGITLFLVEGRMLGEMDLVLFAIGVIGAVGCGLNFGFHAIERRLLRWRPPQASV